MPWPASPATASAEIAATASGRNTGSSIASDYIFRGITQSNHKPSVSAYFEPRYNVTKDLQLYVGLAGASIEQQFGHRFTAVAMAGWQPFTDGNARALLRARMIWSLLPEQGISAQLRWRQYSSSDADVGGAYFNPDRYRTWDAVLSLRRRVGAWTVAGLAGGGQERVDRGSWQSTGVADVRGLGLLVAAELVPGIDARRVAADALDKGLVVNAVTPRALRLAPSLLVTHEEIDRALWVLAAALDAVVEATPGLEVSP